MKWEKIMKYIKFLVFIFVVTFSLTAVAAAAETPVLKLQANISQDGSLIDSSGSTGENIELTIIRGPYNVPPSQRDVVHSEFFKNVNFSDGNMEVLIGQQSENQLDPSYFSAREVTPF